MSHPDLTTNQRQLLEDFLDPASNWPHDLRELFDARCREISGFKPELDREVVGEYVKERFE